MNELHREPLASDHRRVRLGEVDVAAVHDDGIVAEGN